jgi:hypothetical protein
MPSFTAAHLRQMPPTPYEKAHSDDTVGHTIPQSSPNSAPPAISLGKDPPISVEALAG